MVAYAIFLQIESDMSIKVPTLHFAKLMQEAMLRRNESSRVSLYSFDYHNEATFRSVSFNLFGNFRSLIFFPLCDHLW